MSFADDGYVSRDGENWKRELENDLAITHKWFTNSGLVINENKTEFIVFPGDKKSTPDQEILLNGATVKAHKEMKVLGIKFDEKMSWNTQIEDTIKKTRKLAYGMRYLSKYFNYDEMTIVLKSQLFSNVYYNCEIWLNNGLHKRLKMRLLSATTGLIRETFGLRGWPISRVDIHQLANIPTPDQWSNYVHARTLHKILMDEFPEGIYNDLTRQVLMDKRNKKLTFYANNKKRVGLQCFQNRCNFISSKFNDDVWGLTPVAFKNINKAVCLNVRPS